MSGLATAAANTMWAASSVPASSAFLLKLRDPARAQSGHLLSLLRRNASTEYGRLHGFAGVNSIGEYVARVPVTEYEDYIPHIRRAADGVPSVLTVEPIPLLEPTSGTSSGTKLVPYTASLRNEFRSAIAPWIVSLFAGSPGLLLTTSYWSISPVGTAPDKLGDIPVGFEDDAEYLGRIGRWALRHSSAVPSSVASETDMDSFRRLTLVHMLRAKDLGLISVWNPTFLTLLLDFLDERFDEVVSSLEAADADRAREVRDLARGRSGPSLVAALWPRLRLVSCWTDGPCRADAEILKRRLPGVSIQGKGLLATEAFVSFPLLPRHDPVLAVTSHFFEFDPGDGSPTVTASEVEEGGTYSVIVTTGGGFYRYRLHDRVLITGFIERTPTMRFVGKDNVVVDLFGEKLSPDHVATCIEEALAAAGASPDFALLAPDDAEGGEPRYTLHLLCSSLDRERAAMVRDALDALLRSNFHYDYCRRLGQLGPVAVFLIDPAGQRPSSVYTEVMRERGMRLGDIKPGVLDRETGWSRRLRGAYVERP